jgi:hypothetical protein
MIKEMDTVYHYPPDLFELIVETIPALCRSKMSVIGYFRGAGTPQNLLAELEARLRDDPKAMGKYEITRTVLHGLNALADVGIRPRRELLKRITQTEDYTTCWPEDQLKAMGLVSRIRDVINVKDSFTRMSNERELELKKHREQYLQQQERERIQRQKIDQVRDRLSALFAEKNPSKRGKQLETVLNDLFAAYTISIREAFTVRAYKGTIAEQIDGAIELDGDVYIIEMKWMADPVGRPDIAPHLVSLYSRADVAGIYISASGYTLPAVEDVKQALRATVCVLCGLDEIVQLLDQQKEDLPGFLRRKIRVAKLDKQPLFRPFDAQ